MCSHTRHGTARITALVCALLQAVLLLLPRPVHADAVPKWEDLQLVAFSDVIVRGRVTGISVARDDRIDAPYTYVALDVAEVLKGLVRDRRVVLKQLGGRLGSTALQVVGQPTFTVGEEVVVFLEVRPRDGTLTTTAQWLGKFAIERLGNGLDFAQRKESGTSGRSTFGDDVRSLPAWLDELRAAIRDAPPSASAMAIEILPAEAARATPIVDEGRDAVANWRDALAPRRAVRVDTTVPGQPALADGGERQLRQAAEFWTNTGLVTFETGGLQPRGCFTAREPDGRIVVGADTCGELNPRGGTLAISGRWLRYDDERSSARIVGASVITNGGEAPQRLVARSSCFEMLATHELGHVLGLNHASDAGAPMAAFLRCDLGFGTLISPTTGPRGTVRDGIAANGDSPGLGTFTGATLTLAWDAPATGGPLTTYVIEAGTRSGGTDVANFSTDSTATTFSATVSGGVYYIRVRAANAVALSGPSNEVVFALTSLTSAPLGLEAVASGSTVTLRWSPPAAGAVTAYVVEAGSAPGTADLANFNTNSPATTYTATGVGPRTYFVRVRAADAGGVGPPSNEVPVVVAPTCAVAPAAPSNLVTSVSGSTVKLTWTAGAGATSYLLLVGSTAGGSDILVSSLDSAATSLTAVNVGANTYFVRLRSRNTCGVSGSSNETIVIVR